ncbi:MAG: four helix bundle protein [Thermodesulfobacteriota bacterium]|nr:four helix bundle protein [Thermodesulfobacteriota bacterium]
MGERINSYKELRVFQNAMDAAMKIFEVTKGFPAEERFSMVDQMRRSSRSVCANIGEAWRKRRYKAAFIAKLSDAESEACETQAFLRSLIFSPQACGRRKGGGKESEGLTEPSQSYIKSI